MNVDNDVNRFVVVFSSWFMSTSINIVDDNIRNTIGQQQSIEMILFVRVMNMCRLFDCVLLDWIRRIQLTNISCQFDDATWNTCTKIVFFASQTMIMIHNGLWSLIRTYSMFLFTYRDKCTIMFDNDRTFIVFDNQTTITVEYEINSCPSCHSWKQTNDSNSIFFVRVTSTTIMSEVDSDERRNDE
jgi:hypothetical protein